MELADEQMLALALYKRHAFFILNGGPGVGKTTTIRHMIAMFEETVVLTPTALAADQVLRNCGVAAHTLQMVDSSVAFQNQIKGKAIIIDEASMVSALALKRVLKYLRPWRLCLVGDSCQLSCVEGQPIFNTLIAAPHVANVELMVNHRQKQTNSQLFRTITALREPKPVVVQQDGTLNVVSCSSNAAAVEAAAKTYLSNPGAQMLAFSGNMVQNLITATATPNTKVRVMCTQNIYDAKDKTIRLVSNGTLGWQTCPDEVVYDNGFVESKSTLVSQPVPARAIVVHKAQGNEYEGLVIIVLSKWGGDVTPRELIYTALSRAKSKAIIYGTKYSIADVLQSVFVSIVYTEAFAMLHDPETKKVDWLVCKARRNPETVRG
jgi:exodeoxyribonuclease V alpha subunit